MLDSEKTREREALLKRIREIQTERAQIERTYGSLRLSYRLRSSYV